MDANLRVAGTAKVENTATFDLLTTHTAGLKVNSGGDNTGATITNTGALSISNNLVVGGTASVNGLSTLNDDVQIASGYDGSTGTGCTLHGNGNMQCSGNFKA